MKGIDLRLSLGVAFPLTIGVFVYVFLRSTFSVTGNISYVLIYNLPDFLWQIAILFTMDFIFKGETEKINSLFWLAIASSLGITLEILQEKNIIPGTFDWFDIMSYVSAFFIFYTYKISYSFFNPKLP